MWRRDASLVPPLDEHMAAAGSDTLSERVELHGSWQKAREMHHYLIPLTPPLPLGRQRQGESSRQVAGRQLDPSRAAVPWKGATGRRWSQTGPDVIFPASPQGAAAWVDFLMRRGLLCCFWHIGTSSFSVLQRLWCFFSCGGIFCLF